MPFSSAQAVASTLIDQLISLGVRDFVVSPGSRSQALALKAAAAEQQGDIRLHVRIDERSAAFFALGVARETRTPAAVIVTSGTAVANLMPALLEAHYARVPLILLTADRPESLRGKRSNQTVHDTGFTAEFVRYRREIAAIDLAEPKADKSTQSGAASSNPASSNTATSSELHKQLLAVREIAREAFAATLDPAAGPAHLNVALKEPLSGRWADEQVGQEADVQADEQALSGGLSAVPRSVTAGEGPVFVHNQDAPRSVVLAGADAGAAAEEFAFQAGLPLLAEPSSGARYGRQAIQHWEELLNESELQNEIGRIYLFGHATLTRVVGRLTSQIPTVVIDESIATEIALERFSSGDKDHVYAASVITAEGFNKTQDRAWLGAWVVADRALREQHTTVHAPDLTLATAQGYKERNTYARQELARLRSAVTREHLTETTWLATWPHDRLVVAASRLIRVLNRQAAPRNIKVHANRGLAGIDGTIATALGIAVASQSSADPKQSAGVTRLLIGDIAFLHDASSLALQPAEMRPRVQIIIANDGGGTIFNDLEVAQTADTRAFERVMLTPQNVSIAQLAAAYGWQHTLVKNQGELERAFTAPVQGPEILEVLL